VHQKGEVCCGRGGTLRPCSAKDRTKTMVAGRMNFLSLEDEAEAENLAL